MNLTNLTPGQIDRIRAVLFVLCLLPLARLFHAAVEDQLGANPIEFLQRSLGTWTFNFLLITLAVTPLRKATGWHWLIRLRRMFGLFAFFYATMHFLNWLVLDQFFDWRAIVLDIAKRPYVTVGFTAFLLMLPLAATSSNAMVRRLGGRRWQNLHRTVYAIAILGTVHYWWLVKKDITLPLVYTALVALLLGLRALWRQQERQRQLDGAYGTGAPIPQPQVSVVKFMPRRK
ncbi:MAG: sulfoxide reductase heme-binding subunit YedZ [Proteobacteria bacterium]|jgi:sulfoxide reductase heme-binding subunit YedZ|nr:sulfoxide reductase heme-binding subunit YedZ [Pseudomonadota bacterium]MBS1172221.1 sulfoxide reductase heme-binding subunit YedZ [Pseudomonadota bacterium]